MTRRRAGAGGPLTAREREVLVLVAQGYTADASARILACSTSSVVRAIRSARARLRARTTTHAVALAITTGQLPLRRAAGTVQAGKDTRVAIPGGGGESTFGSGPAAARRTAGAGGHR